ncbi:MAG: hypothetical protein LUF35_11030 [Lachnospiraceae bacterium]|nr:hypothetical protein [Lachnospiraceae bacterium]
MVDIHSHILPGLDDGAESMEEAVEMAKIAADSGIFHIVASSHGNFYPYTVGEYRIAFSRLQSTLEHLRIPVKLHSGMEIFLDEKVPALLESGQLLSLNGTDYLLVEFDFEEDPDIVCERLDELHKAGYRVVLAHPERYVFIQKDIRFAGYLAGCGCVLQMNQGSLFGDFGEESRIAAVSMLNDGLIKIIATDAHDTRLRSHDLGRAIRYLSEHFSQRSVHLWLSENPSRILKGMTPLACK